MAGLSYSKYHDVEIQRPIDLDYAIHLARAYDSKIKDFHSQPKYGSFNRSQSITTKIDAPNNFWSYNSYFQKID